MKFTLSRLHDFLQTDASINEIADALNNLGLEVEEIYDPNKTLGDFTVGQIIEAEQHPNADRLRVCKVQTKDDIIQIVCGAPNARKGIKVCVSLPGMYIPGLDITIKKGKIRDIESCGMLCSAGELGMQTDDDRGIMELPEDAPIGAKVIDIIGINDPVIEISVTPNRPDALGVYGIAKDLASYGLGTLLPLDIPQIKGSFDSPVTFDVHHPESCPHFVGYYIKNVKIGQSPEKIRQFLAAVGCKSINNAVDITNYLSYSFARPLHVFDADKIGQKMGARLSKQGEKLLTLDELTHELGDNDIVIADEHNPVAIAGIMGGMDSGISDNTVNIFLESAYFNPDYIAQTGRRLNILSDARYRFERGIDPAFTENGAKIAAQMIVDLCGGEISHSVVAGKPSLPDTAYKLDKGTVLKLTGIDIAFEQQEKILKSLGFTVINQGAKLICIPPSSRPDILGEADLVEEIVRIYGINNVKPIKLPVPDEKQQPLDASQSRIIKARLFVANRGIQEAVTYSFTDHTKASLFSYDKPLLTLDNPISSDLSTMRPSLLCGLLSAASRNIARGFKNTATFEIGRVFYGTDPSDQPQNLAILKTGASHDKHWYRPVTDYSIYDIKADIVATLEQLGAPVSGVSITADAPSYYHPARSGTIKLGKVIYGYFGELHPKVIDHYDLSGRPVAGEILIDNIPLPKQKKSTTLPKGEFSNLQAVHRDFAFVVDKNLEAETLLKAIRKAEKKLISKIDIFDIYTGSNLDSDKKSVALRVTLQPTDTTLTDESIEIITKNILGEAEKIGAILR